MDSLLITAPNRGRNCTVPRCSFLLACFVACVLAPYAARAQSEPDFNADPLYGPIEQLRADPLWRVYAAVITHDHKTLQALLDGGDSPNRFSPRYRSPLVMACQIGDLDAIKILLSGGAKIDLSDSIAPNRLGTDETALTKAIDRNHIEIVRYLLAQGAQVNLRGPLKGETPLFSALRSRNMEILTLLLQAHADISVRNKVGYTVLALASLNNDVELVDFLKANGAKYDSPREELLFAASHGDVAAIQRILGDVPARTGATPGGSLKLVNEPSKDGITPLMAAASQGQTAAVNALIAAGADINALNSAHQTPLLMAIGSKHKSTIMALLDAGADPNILSGGESTALFETTLMLDDPDIVHRLINGGNSVDSIGIERDGSPNANTPLMSAAGFGRIETVRILLDAHVDVNARRFEGSTALMDAACSGQTDIVALLLRAGADPSIKDKKGKTALDCATETSQTKIIEMLKKQLARSTINPPNH
jgi:ankyrin repeat protein